MLSLRTLWPDLASFLRNLVAPAAPEPPAYPFTDSDIAQYERHTRGAHAVLDEQTWADLMGRDYLAWLTAGASILGQQWLYRALRRQDGAGATLWQEAQALGADQGRLEHTARAVAPLRAADAEVASLLFQRPPEARAWWEPYVALPPWALAVCVPCGFLTPFAWLGVLGALCALMWIHMSMHELMTRGERERAVLQRMLVARSALDGDPQALALRKVLARLAITASLPLAREYADWFGLAAVKHHLRCRAAIERHQEWLRACFEHCARTEAVLVLARLAARADVCVAQTGPARFDGVRHPLLADALPVSVAWREKGIFLTGRNGEGKSTLLRTVGLNLLTGRALGFCHARSASVPAGPLYASLRNEDSLLGGESLYVSELRRAREMLEAPPGSVFLIDEIFRGTNYLDAVAAGAAVLERLAQRGTVLVSSHNVILAALLRHRLDAFCLVRTAQGVRLEPGVLSETNARDLLAERGLGAEVGRDAARVADWLGAYLASPAAAERVLA